MSKQKAPEEKELEPQDSAVQGRREMTIVGVGASAGGLEALQALFKDVQPMQNVAFVVAQHLSPTYKSMMVDLLAKGAQLEVLAAEDNQVIESGHIYICPPNRTIRVRDGHIRLTEPEEATYSPRPSIDLLFESIAADHKVNAIGIILSGTGSDGARGIRAIKSEGGATLVQDPETAKYDGMPNAAISTSSVDFILAPEHMGAELAEILQFPTNLRIQADGGSTKSLYDSIVEKLKAASGVDFSNYKRNTIERRIERRMAALKITSLTEYNNHLARNANETLMLFQNILIGVTSFFRDEEAFEIVGEQLKARLAANEQKVFRAWVPGCSSGEEAYSIGIMVSELLGDEAKRWKIQIFATDIDDGALSIGRRGQYPESALIGMPKALIDKYFHIDGEQFLANRELRENIIFSRHDINSDPPFLRLDFISCRNLLIYFDAELQRRIIPAFHYSLNENGLLLLGKSETIGTQTSYFKTVDSRWRVFEANYLGEKSPPTTTFSSRARAYQYTDPETRQGNSNAIAPRRPLREVLTQKFQRYLMPMCILINETSDILYSTGNIPYLTRPAGDSTDYLFKNLNPVLSTEVRGALLRSSKEQELVRTPYLQVKLGDDSLRYVRVVVAPFDSDEFGGNVTLIAFEEESSEVTHIANVPAQGAGATDEAVKNLEMELARQQEQTQTLVEELETSNEELQSMNEELQSANEELQSTNEELETTNEELQSTNEELQTAYAELTSAYRETEHQKAELERSKAQHADLNEQFLRTQAAARSGYFSWNLETDAMEWSPVVYQIFGIDEEIIRPSVKALINLVHPEDKQKVRNAFEKASESRKLAFQFRVTSLDDSVRHVEIVADFRGEKALVRGTIRDVTELISSRVAADAFRTRLQTVLNTSLCAIHVFNLQERRNSYMNEAYERLTGYTPQDIYALDSEQYMALFHPDDRDAVREHIETMETSEVADSAEPITLRYRFRHKDGRWLTLFSSDVLLRKPGAGAGEYLGCFLDITEVNSSQA